MSIDTKQLVHIAIETTVISVLFVFFYNKNRVLSEQIDELENIVSQQQDTLQKHEAMILNLSNSVKLLKNTQQSKISKSYIIENDSCSSASSDSDVEETVAPLPIEENNNIIVETKTEPDYVMVTKTDSKKKKKKKKKKVEQTEQMLDNELLEELKDLE